MEKSHYLCTNKFNYSLLILKLMSYTILDIENFGKGRLGTYLVATTSCDNKLNAAGKALYAGRLTKVTLAKNVRLGCEYGNLVNIKAGSNDFTPSPLKGFVWVSYPFVKRSIKKGVDYLNINYRACDERTMFVSAYVLDNTKVLTTSEIAAIENTYFTKTGSHFSAKQAAAGVTDEHEQTKVLSYALDSLAYLGRSLEDAERVYANCLPSPL